MKIKLEHMMDAGCSGRKNQDAYLVKKQLICNKSIVLGIVCDGVGGVSDGDVASRRTIDYIEHNFWNQIPKFMDYKFSIEQIAEQLIIILNKINYGLYIESKKKGKRTGTTIALCFVMDEDYVVMNVGDSRVYWHKGNQIYRTKDHTAASLREGVYDDEDTHILWQSIGSQKIIKVDQHFGKIELPMEFLLTTDGAYRSFHKKEIYDYCQNGNLKQMKKQAIKRKESDNMTAVRIQLQ